ncbi:MAG: hypothetical protein QM796_06535 [Chthoniobacteraceae bacterium]
MTTISAQVPDYLAQLAQEVARKENVTVDQIVALALSAQVSAWKVREDMEVRAQRGESAGLEKILSKVPGRSPLAGDEL